MKLIDLNPFAPRDPIARAKFAAVFMREMPLWRKKPSFWIGGLFAVTSGLVLVYRLDDAVDLLMLIVMLLGFSFVFDTATSHLVKRLAEKEE